MYSYAGTYIHTYSSFVASTESWGNSGIQRETSSLPLHLPATSLHYCTAECDVIIVVQLHNGSIKLGQVYTRSIWTWASITVRHVGYRADNPSSRILESVLVHTHIEVIYHTYTTTYIHIHTLLLWSSPQSVYLLPVAAESREKHRHSHSRSRSGQVR